ncbi:MFS-type transporter dbaD like protein [Verticillium longisporum]|uniref:MFS-type transporter dbaD like protein n=1 Tax=Verticillium longisporum TaxID=100787 RepID=A0A8I2ZZN9_VERLO|nr:MFS-type transporter dbaD like protein [Verticillium longisporum]
MRVPDDAVPAEQPPKPQQRPNKGLKAWLQVLGAFFIYFNTWGLISSFGSFQASFEKDLLRYHTPFEISTIGSLQSFLMVFLGFVAGPVYDLGYSRQQLWLGSLLIVLGTVAQSFSTKLWQLLLSQGVVIGIGLGILAVLGVALPSLWFDRNLPLANGVNASGSGVGGLVLPVVFRNLQNAVGFPWAVRTVAVICLVTMGIAVMALETPKVSSKRRAFVDRSITHDMPYLAFLVACVFVLLGIYTPFVYIQSFALDNGIVSAGLATYILAILNASSILGRIVPNIFAAEVGAMNMSPGMRRAFITLAAIYGFVVGTFFALQPTIFVRLTPDPTCIGTRFGMAFTVMSFALLFGPPIAGALRREFGYDGAWGWAGATLGVGILFLALSRGLAKGWSLKSRV